MIVIDAADMILGRIANHIAKQTLLGEKIIVVNCEKAVVSGKKKALEAKYLHKIKRGDTFHGPFYPKRSELIVKRAIRGMLPYKQEKGRKAFKRVLCYSGMPNQYAEQKLEVITSAHLDHIKTGEYVTIAHLAKKLGGK